MRAVLKGMLSESVNGWMGVDWERLGFCQRETEKASGSRDRRRRRRKVKGESEQEPHLLWSLMTICE